MDSLAFRCMDAPSRLNNDYLRPRACSRITRVAATRYQYKSLNLKAKFYEWVVAQELWRLAAIRGDEIPERLNFWKSENLEINFVVTNDNMLEVKMGATYPLDFTWFPKIFPNARLKVITTTPFETERIHGLPMEVFLMEE